MDGALTSQWIGYSANNFVYLVLPIKMCLESFVKNDATYL